MRASVNAPAWNTTNIFMYGLSEAGATPVQELAYGLSWGKSIIEAGLGAGLQADEFVGRLGFQIGCTVSLFEEVAKFRAHRRMWATLCKQAGCQKPSNMHARVHVHTSGYVLTAQQLLNNNARITLQALAAVLGGVQSIHTCSYDEAVGIPTEESSHGLAHAADPDVGVGRPSGRRSARRLVLHREADRRHGGRGVEIFEDLEARGGYMHGIETGEIKRAIDTSSYEMKQRINSGALPVVGVNKYASDTPQNYEAFRIDHAIEAKACERLERYRAGRDQAAVDHAIAGVRAACEELKAGTGSLMPALIEAARKGVTNGEMMVPMREAFGWFVSE